MMVRKLRLQRGWSQEQLAEMSGLSVRTIQRIERGHRAGMESLKSLAAVFETELSTLQEETAMNTSEQLTLEEQRAIEYVRDIKGFYSHLISYASVIFGLLLLNALTSPHYWWVIWPALGWGIGLAIHGLNVFEMFDVFGPDWEKKQIEKRLGRKL